MKCLLKIRKKFWQLNQMMEKGALYGHLIEQHLLKRPMILFCLSLFLSCQIAYSGTFSWFYLLGGVFLLKLILVFQIENKKTMKYWILFLTFCLILGFYGYFSIEGRRKTAYTFFEAYKENKIWQGRIVSIPTMEAQWQNYILEIKDNNQAFKISFLSQNTNLQYGNYVQLNGNLALASAKRNLGGFDQKEYLNRQGIFLTLKAKDTSIQILSTQKSFLKAKDFFYWVQSYFLNLRQKLGDLWSSILPDQEAQLLKGMLFGQTKGLSSENQMYFRVSNLSHLTAVSGSHVNLMLWPIFRNIQKGWGKITRNRRYSWWLFMPLILIFGFLTGWTPSVQRSLLMLVILILAKFWWRQYSALDTLLVVTFCLFAYNPWLALNQGLNLSITATIAIICLAPRLKAFLEYIFKPQERPLNEKITIIEAVIGHKPILSIPFWASRKEKNYKSSSIKKVCIDFLSVYLAVQLGMLPWSVFLSSKISLDFLAIHFLAGWLFQAIIFISLPYSFMLIGVKFFPQGIEIYKVLLLPLQGLLSLFLGFIKSAFSGTVTGWSLNNLVFSLFLGILLGGLYCVLPKTYLRKTIKKIAVVFLLLGFLSQLAVYWNRPDAIVVFSDVGQGDSTLVMLKNRVNFLIDGGDKGSGEKVLIPLLNYFGIYKLDFSVLTHLHSDHGKGLLEIAEHKRVKKMYVPFLPPQLNEIKELSEISILEQAKTLDLEVIRKDQRFSLAKNVDLLILHPSKIIQEGGNEDSLICLLIINNIGILFTSDAGFFSEKILMEDQTTEKLLRQYVSFLKVGHHGSRFSTSQEFLDILPLKTAIISVGANNLYHHPAPEVLEKLFLKQVEVWRTDLQGAIIMTIKDQKITIHSMLT